MHTVDELIMLFRSRGDSQYGGECVTQLEHALQAATFAMRDGASEELVAAALLHDVGHLLHRLPDDAPDRGVDDHHEASASNLLTKLFPKAVTEPIRLHVAAKRYLCAVEPEYMGRLSHPSMVSLTLQGGPMTDSEIIEFEANPFVDSAIKLRKWDDEAKIPNFPTEALENFESLLRAVATPSN